MFNASFPNIYLVDLVTPTKRLTHPVKYQLFGGQYMLVHGKIPMLMDCL